MVNMQYSTLYIGSLSRDVDERSTTVNYTDKELKMFKNALQVNEDYYI